MSQAFRPKEYFRPTSIEETVQLLSKFGERSKIIGGGTGIYEVAHRGLLSEVQCLIDISLLQLDRIAVGNSSVTIGATTTMSEIVDSVELSRMGELSALFEALRVIQPLQVKNVATIGGAICTAIRNLASRSGERRLLSQRDCAHSGWTMSRRTSAGRAWSGR